ncbi:flavodoxin-dependent (E)-4-hydroxy-3-methylbut-2-enyl-diphosphate synthase [Candidatus Omnitrophota bacterium]
MTRQIKVGRIKIGKGSKVVIQSMTKTDTRDVARTVKQINELEKAGCELVRVAVKDFVAADAIKNIKKRIKIPLVADIHFDYRLAILAIENGADKIRLNPGNIYKEEQVTEVARLAKKKHIPVRVGINSGSTNNVKGSSLADCMVKKALGYIKILERARFYDIIVSLKASDVLTTVDAYRKFSKKSEYPLHLGITAAGPISTGIVKSSIGIGLLLSEGIGDTIRVSLTADPCEEVIAGKNILQALGLRQFGPEIISCPTCGRCQVDLQKIVKEIDSRFTIHDSRFTKLCHPIVAIMGCEVNGPGEAREADIGIAFGKDTGILFKKGKVVKRLKEKEAVKAVLNELQITNQKRR